MLPNGLKLFVVDIIDDRTGIQEWFYVVVRTEDSALKRFVKWINKFYYSYSYYFREEEDQLEIEHFLEMNGNDLEMDSKIKIKADIYDYVGHYY